MITKKRLLTGMFLLSFILALTMVSAGITINSPTSGLAVNGTYNFSITTDLDEPLNCTFATSDDGVFQIVVNDTDGDTEFSTLNDTAVLTEALATTLTVNCTNASDDTQQSTVTFDIDNTDPVCTSSLNIGEETINFMDAFGIYPSQASTDTTTLTHAWTLYDPSGNSQQTSTSTTPNFASDDFDEIGQFILALVVTDEVSKSKSCTNLTVDVIGSDDDVIPGTGSIITILKENRTTAFIIGGGIFLIFVGAVGYFIIQASKK